MHIASFQKHLEPGGISKLPMGKLSSDFKGCKTKSTCASLPYLITRGYGSFMKQIVGQTSWGIGVVNGTSSGHLVNERAAIVPQHSLGTMLCSVLHLTYT